jgi:hypothetical protein
MPTVSYSETSTYLLCRRRHFYGYGLELERIAESDSLNEGKLAHKVLETFYKQFVGETPDWDTAVLNAMMVFPEDWEPTERRANLMETLTTYFENEPFINQGYEVLAVEQEFNLLWDSETDSKYPFVVDLILRDPWNQVVVVDHKTCYEFLNADTATMAPQIPLYIGALRALGYPAAYGIYNMLRTRKIKDPRLDQQLGIMHVRPTDERVLQSFKQHANVSTDISQLKALSIEEQDAQAYRVNNMMVCNSCSFKELCIGELIGDNVKLILEGQYKKRQRREFAEVTAEVE